MYDNERNTYNNIYHIYINVRLTTENVILVSERIPT